MTNEDAIREGIEGIIQLIESGDVNSAKDHLGYLREDHLDRLMQPLYSEEIRSSRSASPPSYAMDEFGRERVLSVNKDLNLTLRKLNEGNHAQALEAAQNALSTWNRGAF